MRLVIKKLASPPIASPPRTEFLPRNELLQDSQWVNEIGWLYDIYNDIAIIWEKFKNSEQDEMLFKQTNPKLSELVLRLLDLASYVPQVPVIKQDMQNAYHDFETSVMYAHSGDFISAVLYQSYSLVKINRGLENFTLMAKMPSRTRFSSFNEKTAYGYDISGEIFEGSGELAVRENQKNIDDIAEPWDHHDTPLNPANITVDCDADKEYRNELAWRHKRINWPPRTR